jgi:RecJ-like exonuclease
MSKESTRKCPDCDGEDFYALFGGKGNGKCSNCHGKGEVWSIGEGLEVFRLDLEKVEACKTCSGTGQCQTCGGTGFEYYNDDHKVYSSETSSNHYDNSGSYDNYSNSSYNDTPSTDFISSFFGSIVMIGLFFLIQELVCNKGSSEQKNFQDNEKQLISVRCPQCNGERVININVHCYSCEGSGLIICKGCNGKRNQACDYFYCAGKGYFTCTGCDGNGEFGASAHIKCEECEGTGKMTCPACTGSGRVQCSMCLGKGKTQCKLCSGKGEYASKEKCSTCNGKGSIY